MTLFELWRTPGIKTLLLTGIISTLFTIGLFLYSFDQSDDRVVGTVVRVTSDTIIIRVPDGNELTLLITPETKTRALGPLDQLTPGTRVMAGGRKVASSTIAAFGIRRVEDRLDYPLRN
jgi:hypothetical protein